MKFLIWIYAPQEQAQAQQQTAGNGATGRGNRYNESMINREQLKNFGVSRDYLQEKVLLDGMLKGYKTNALVPVSMNFGSAVLRTDARLSFQQSAAGHRTGDARHTQGAGTGKTFLRACLFGRG